MGRPSDQALALSWHLIDGYDRFVTLKNHPSRANILRGLIAAVGVAWAGYWYFELQGRRRLRKINKRVDKFIHK